MFAGQPEVETMKRLLSTLLLPGLMLAPVGLAACGSSSSSNTTGGSGGGSTAPASTATVSTKKEPGYGTVLVNSSGQAVYLLSNDPAGGSKCTASCAAGWPPLSASGKPTAGPGADASLLSTFKRSDGKAQVLYNHHALYTYAHGGLVSGEGVASNGGIFYLVAPDGKPVTKTTTGGY
jgi:predicted lipoprotein with Yx(FWY)xxD motif